MTSIPVKDIGSIMSRSVASAAGGIQTPKTASFEAVWNNQTEKGNTSELPSDGQKNVPKEDVDVRDSLRTKDIRRSVPEEEVAVDKAPKNDLESMDNGDREEVMEVLGTVVMELVQRIADAFDMTAEEVQNLMTDLGLEQLDLLQQENLGNLLLAAGGAEDVTSLLTDEQLYQQYQTIMEQLNLLLTENGEALQVDGVTLAETVTSSVTDVADVVDVAEQETLPIEVTIEDDAVAEEATDTVQMKISVDETDNDSVPISENAVTEVRDSEQPLGQNKSQTQSRSQEQPQNQPQNQLQNQPEEQVGKQTVEKQKPTEDKNQTGNLFLQNLKTESFEPQLSQISETTSSWDTDTMDIMRQIMDYMKIQVKSDVSDLEMQLHPASLGTLQIHVASKGGTVTAQFITQNETVKAALESQMIQLKESFAEQGVKVDAIEVTVQTHQFEQNLEQGRGRQEETDRKNRSRRIQLDGPLTMDDLNDMEEAEQLAAQMMETNGNTVDYTA